MQRDEARLADIVIAGVKLLKYTQSASLDKFVRNEGLRLICERLFLIIGEAASKLAAETQAEFPDIEWRKIIAFRHRIIHEYDKINYERMWRIITDEIPVLVQRLMPFVPLNPEDLE